MPGGVSRGSVALLFFGVRGRRTAHLPPTVAGSGTPVTRVREPPPGSYLRRFAPPGGRQGSAWRGACGRVAGADELGCIVGQAR